MSESAHGGELLIKQQCEHGEYSAYIGVNRGDIAWRVMADGFLEVAERTCARLATNDGSPDAEIYVALTNVRHGTELFVKYMVVFTASIIDVDSNEKVRPGHNISKNWELVLTNLEALAPDIHGHSFGENVSAFTRFITEIEQWDLDGQTFRYPEDRKGNRNLDSVEYINIHHLLTGIREIQRLAYALDYALGCSYPC